MGKIVIAGGSTGIGRAIADVLDSTKTHKFIILTRRSSGPDTRAVDYTNIDALVKLFDHEGVDTVISTLSINDDECGQAQMNLIEAANRSATTKRFLPSEFGMRYTPDNIGHLPSYRYKLQAVELLERTDLEFSLVSIGLFLDYWSTPRIPTRLSYAPNMWLDAENNVAVIPGDGDTPIVLTHSSDAARSVVSLLDVSHWKKRYYVIGNCTSLNNAVKLAEEVKGVKFDVHYASKESLERGEVAFTPRLTAALPPDEGMQSSFEVIVANSGLSLARGDLNLNPDEEEVLGFQGAGPLSIRKVFEAWK
ncbi:hypothetical protein FSARC_6685 [Fusarium sarcochroum]|uniref:NmrA-like domain-containing protein n=1 Tax=Fusarium sarcochroum TaxID=1208366 RepID=A0A8H4TWL4_9HYPO|nr:hypothetical protein FSARC_6685 [Fusarium sarcochroum]